eukprot:CAMPEP_0175171576 /NCGR_PEP_ID=MMETSP0087-20121206/30924_1 /TAXON_ID=136419 /ORGANISM="Unknown Unknown, Strain D1" /LENGTH=258 /DNA_ID=CAMNT_0016462491 /DNA_START=513 /DNA_END=1289 /DNA_ORIENTATION=+
MATATATAHKSTPSWTKIPQYFAKFVYFSLATQTSTGFGDITPVHPLPQIFVAFHAIVSVLFHFIVVGLGMTTYLGSGDAHAPTLQLDDGAAGFGGRLSGGIAIHSSQPTTATATATPQQQGDPSPSARTARNKKAVVRTREDFTFSLEMSTSTASAFIYDSDGEEKGTFEDVERASARSSALMVRGPDHGSSEPPGLASDASPVARSLRPQQIEPMELTQPIDQGDSDGYDDSDDNSSIATQFQSKLFSGKHKVVIN